MNKPVKYRLTLHYAFTFKRGDWYCSAPGTYSGHGHTRWLAIAHWHQLLRRLGPLQPTKDNG